jgi:uncharacterized protein YjbI with pentapeptide repeats
MMAAMQDEKPPVAQQNSKPWTLKELGGKPVWEWLQLLIVPVALAVIGLWFTAQQDARQQEIESSRAEAAQDLEEQVTQDEALQAYFDQLGQLILERNLLDADVNSPVFTLAQARTSTAIRRSDEEHRDIILQFLTDSGLAGTTVRIAGTHITSIDGHPPDGESSPDGETSFSLLKGINLSGADLRGASLSQVDLSYANLTGADLRGPI